MPAGQRWDLDNPRTDLALEAHGYYSRRTGGIPGVDVRQEKQGEVSISRVRVLTPEAGQAIGKPPGNYITIEARGLRQRSETLKEQVARSVAAELGPLLNLGDDSHVLVVGLGNARATPDALGPKVVEELMVTRHLPDYVPEDLRGGLRPVSALAPGVLGTTGIETVEIIEGVAARVRPDVIVAIDALASRSIERILTTIQIADTGLNPGGGVGNRRRPLNRETLGIPVIAIGVPTVVHAVTIALDTIELLVQRLRTSHPFYSYLDRLDGNEKHDLVQEVLAPYVGDLMVTPKEIDMLVDDLAQVLAGGINAACHPRLAGQDRLV